MPITKVPQADELIDICLNKTNRKTPTIIRKHFEIVRIRKFYNKKIKFASDEFCARLDEIVKDFPVLEDMHPFYSDLISVLYDRDQYKIALGKINTCKSKIIGIEKNSLKMIKFADTLYRCKCLKRAGLGQMVTNVSKLKDELKYLEEVRMHLQRLPTIDPYSRTLIVAGFPNVGKSSYISTITNCKTEVQPYEFTTQALYCGHFTYSDLSYQIIDTPGILDRPLDSRSKIEMLSITALAHLKSCILFFIDVSGIGHSIEEQIELYNNLNPLLNSQTIIVLSKIDVLTDVNQIDENLVNECLTNFVSENTILKEFLRDKKYVGITTKNNVNFKLLSDTAAEMILNDRIENKKNIETIENLLHTINTDKPMNSYEFNHIGENRFFNSINYKDTYLCENKYDVIPELINGKNIIDFYMNKDFNSLKDIVIPDLKHYNTLSKEEREYYDLINDTRIQANMDSVFNKRRKVPDKSYQHDGFKCDNEMFNNPNKNTVNFNKKAQSNVGGKTGKLADAKHLYRSK
ncbi:NOG1 [Hepatospora eriocheir]|uniref:NOG1 n=1 Tax=Hepatospora eriocheir TaxID=1081669 RepID=A0A1X0QHG5_9MICR|nr:NOG1 [Hepatospora eriocheir]